MSASGRQPSIDIRPLLRAHAEWIIHLRESVYGSATLDVSATIRDDECDLGRWIYGEAARLRHLPEYEAARQAHAAFHAEAAEVVRLMNAGRCHEAALAVDHGGRLRNQSAAMVRAFLWLSHRLAAQGGETSAFATTAIERRPAEPINSVRRCPG